MKRGQTYWLNDDQVLLLGLALDILDADYRESNQEDEINKKTEEIRKKFNSSTKRSK